MNSLQSLGILRSGEWRACKKVPNEKRDWWPDTKKFALMQTLMQTCDFSIFNFSNDCTSSHSFVYTFSRHKKNRKVQRVNLQNDTDGFK